MAPKWTAEAKRLVYKVGGCMRAGPGQENTHTHSYSCNHSHSSTLHIHLTHSTVFTEVCIKTHTVIPLLTNELVLHSVEHLQSPQYSRILSEKILDWGHIRQTAIDLWELISCALLMLATLISSREGGLR